LVIKRLQEAITYSEVYVPQLSGSSQVSVTAEKKEAKAASAPSRRRPNPGQRRDADADGQGDGGRAEAKQAPVAVRGRALAAAKEQQRQHRQPQPQPQPQQPASGEVKAKKPKWASPAERRTKTCTTVDFADVKLGQEAGAVTLATALVEVRQEQPETGEGSEGDQKDALRVDKPMARAESDVPCKPQSAPVVAYRRSVTEASQEQRQAPAPPMALLQAIRDKPVLRHVSLLGYSHELR
jgi:hypothetical protein